MATPTKSLPAPQVVQADVPRIVIPESVTYAQAADYCAARAKEEAEIAPFPIELPAAMPWPCAYALQRLLDREYSATPVPNEGVEMTVRTARGPVTVRWCTWNVHGLGRLVQESKVDRANGRLDYRVVVQCKRMLRPAFERFRTLFLAEVDKHELYSGCALQLSIMDDGGEESCAIDYRNPFPSINIDKPDTNNLVLSHELSDAVAAEVFYPITHATTLRAAGFPTRRGILLAGRPGTGKTLCARLAAGLAIEQGWTVFYLADARGLAEALRLAQAHAPALLVAEDIDRTLGGERSSLTDVILNSLDGLDRSAQVVFVATTNAPENLPAPLLRPGRLDSVLHFPAPDAEAAERLLKLYLRDERTDLGPLSLKCAGLLSAAIREVVARATLTAQASRGSNMPSTYELHRAAESVWRQQRMLEHAEAPKKRPAPTLRVTMVEPEQASRLERDGNGTAPEGLLETLNSALSVEA